ncbi:hypothetical protein KPL47_24640, partial [Clostridium estertheticum]|uniref:condensation domain-containing protein n=1 Tax=Clostridium estertheticum TaxID=238834 RepID=UPI001C0C681A
KLTFRPYVSNNNVEKFDITMNAVEGNEEIYFSLSYATSAYKRETIEKMIKYFEHIIKLTSSDLSIIIKKINLITDEEAYDFLESTNYNNFNEDEFDFEI